MTVLWSFRARSALVDRKFIRRIVIRALPILLACAVVHSRASAGAPLRQSFCDKAEKLTCSSRQFLFSHWGLAVSLLPLGSLAMTHLNHWGLAGTLVPLWPCSDSREPLGPCSGTRAPGPCSDYHIFSSMSKQPLMIRVPLVPHLCPQLVPSACDPP